MQILTWLETVTRDRPNFTSERVPQQDRTATVKQLQTPGHEPQTRLDTKTY